jgi:hypothetical protein
MPFIISTSSQKSFLALVNGQWVISQRREQAERFESRVWAEKYKYYAGVDGIILEVES